MTSEPQTFKDHIPALDSLRGLGAVMVVFTHLPVHLLPPEMRVWRAYVKPGYLAIDIFFVLSGFLITRILLADKAKGLPLKFFLARRFLRIFPIYYLFLAVMCFFIDWSEMVWSFTYLSNFYYPFHAQGSFLRHTWSLAVEEHYYMFWSFIVYWTSRRVSQLIAMVGFMVVSLVSILITIQVLDTTDAKRISYMGTQYRMCSLAVGSSLAYIEPTIRRNTWKFLGVAALMVCLGEWAIQEWVVTRHPTEWLPLVRMVAFPVVSGGIVLAGVCMRKAKGPLAWIMGFPPLLYLGKVSYGWYLFHLPLFHFAFVQWGETYSALAIGAAMSLTVASASFYWIERPLLRLKSRFQ